MATTAGDLPCKKVFHAIGPVYTKNGFECPVTFRQTVAQCLKLATILKFESIAFPALCSGLYKFPVSVSGKLLIEEILHFNQHDSRRTIKDISVVEIEPKRVAILEKVFDQRDFDSNGVPKAVIAEQE